MRTTHTRKPDQDINALLDRIQERVMRAIPDAKSTILFDDLMREAQARGLNPIECLDYIEEQRSRPK